MGYGEPMTIAESCQNHAQKMMRFGCCLANARNWSAWLQVQHRKKQKSQVEIRAKADMLALRMEPPSFSTEI